MARYSSLSRIIGILVLFSIAGCGRDAHDISEVELVWLNIGHEEIAASPQRASRLGLLNETAAMNAQLRLNDGASSVKAALHANRLEYLETLETIEKESLTDAQNSTLSALVHSYRIYADAASFGHGDITPDSATPYALTHISGAFLDLPQYLVDTSAIRSLADAQDYVTQLTQATVVLNDDRQQLVMEANAGVVPPKVLLDAVLTRLDAIITQPHEETAYVAVLTESLAQLESEDAETEAALIRQAQSLYADAIVPELVALRATVESLIPTAPTEDGLGALPYGEQWYEAALALQTGVKRDDAIMSIRQDAEVRLEQLDRAVDTALRRAAALDDMPDISLEEFLQQAERPTLPDAPEQQAVLEADLSGLLELMRRRLATMFDLPPQSTPEIRIELNPSHDGGASWRALKLDRRDGVIYANAPLMTSTPGLLLPTELYYIGYPGEALQNSLVRNAELALTDRLFSNPGFEAGWALYALDLTRELNAFDDAPHALLGLLLIQRLETARAIADIKLHTEDWSVDDVAVYLAERTGFSVETMREDALIMASFPGLAVAPAAGREFILELRGRSEYALAEKFDIKSFHSVILDRGPRPLDAVSEDIDRWIAAIGSSDPLAAGK